MHGRWKSLSVLGIVLLSTTGCGKVSTGAVEGFPAMESPVSAGSHFNPKTAGAIRGHVTWKGSLPVVGIRRIHVNPLGGSLPPPRTYRENPNAPAIDPLTNGVGHAVVFLRGIDPRMGKPWDQPPVKVEMRDRRLLVLQGEASSPVGFVHRNDPVAMASRDPLFHSLHASGAEFFTLAFPDRDQTRVRPLTRKGPIELTSAAGFYWMRAYLFVDDHPYYARTAATGAFFLGKVPAGRYQLVCWLPDWHEARQERDPESAQIARVHFGHPVEIVKSVTVEAGKEALVDFMFKTTDFGPRPGR
jgi:hypothetical protein